MASRFYSVTSSALPQNNRFSTSPDSVAIKKKRSRRHPSTRFNPNVFADDVQPLSIQPKSTKGEDLYDPDKIIKEFGEPEDPIEIARKRRRTWAKAIHGKGAWLTAKDFIKSLPSRIWNSYIVALLIPKYRPEWGKFMVWEATLSEKKDRKSLNTRSVVNKLSTKLSRRKRKKTRRKKRHHHATDQPPRPERHDHSECMPVRINVSGQIFEPQLRTLKQFPNTLLGDPRRMAQFYDPDCDEFFFDRHRSCFECILYYYNTGGILRRPPGIANAIFVDEVKFFDLGQEVLQGLLHNTSTEGGGEDPLPENLLQRKLWLLFEYPESSYQSRIVACMSIAVVIVSIFEFCIETLPEFSYTHNDEAVYKLNPDRTLSFSDPFFFLETLCIIFFVMEYLVRAITCPHFFTFAKNISNIIDLIAIMPYFLNVWYYVGDEILGKSRKASQLENKAVSLTIFRIIRLVRVFRILKLSRHNRGLKILGKTLKASIRELGLLVFFLMLGIVVFSSAMFFAEAQYENTPFTSIPSGFWFGVVTMTTLGYGDVVPEGPYGKFIGALCAIAGVLTISLPVPVIVSNFNMFYSSEDMNKQQAAAARNMAVCDHVEHCPFYAAWYTSEGQVVENRIPTAKTNTESEVEKNSLRWLIGEQRPDYSDSDFDPLLEDVLLRKHEINKKKRRMSRRFSKKMSRKSLKLKI